jgi:NAD-dependent dihydropyrimidine dehydrogenase PreA subunit
MEEYNYIENVAELSLDSDSCIGCRLCTIVCPHGVFDISGKKAVIVRPDDCMECGACSQNCPVEAITVNPGVGCAALIISRWLAKAGIQTKGCC